jgi:transglutaminase-like putative cysteine protease/tetratricopeptide (TPR) repeat protein
MRRLPCFVLALFFSIAPVVRADDWPVPRGPANEPLPYRYDAKHLDGVPRDFLEDAAACVLFTRTTHLIEADGTIVTTVHEITRFNGRKGIEKLGEYHSIYFNPRYEKLTLNDARVLKRDGGRVEVEPRHVQLRDVATDYQVYDEDKQLVISWPNLQVGDAYEVKWTVRSKNPEYAGEFFTRYTFGDEEYPVVRDELYVRVPQNKPLKYAAVNATIDLTRSETGGQTAYHWKTVNKLPLPRDEARPSKEELHWQVACSTFPSWPAVGKWKQQVRAKCWKCTDAIAATIARVAGPEPTQLAKARALTYWVRQNVRYLSRGPEGKGYTPHPPEQVHANLFGDCKDQAQLLAVMLRQIGVPVWLVTLGTRDDGQVLEEVPSPWGTHAILMVEIDGKAHWIDTTVSQAAWDFLPRGDCDRLVCLVKDGEVKLARTPPFTYKDFRVEQTTYVDIGANGTSRSRRESSYHGSGAWSKRDTWIDSPLGERRRLATAELQDAHNRARLLHLKVDEKSLRNFDGPVRAEVEFEIPDHFGGEAREGALSDSIVWQRLLAYSLDPGRDVPLELPSPFESVHRYLVELPAALRCSDPPDEKRIDSPWGFFQLKVTADPVDPHRLEVRMHTRLAKTRVEPEQFAEFQRFHDAVAKAYRAWLTLQSTRDLADAPALENALADAHSAKVLARLYLDNQRAADARRVLALAVQQSPEDKTLWELCVQAAADLAEKEQYYRAMVARFPKDGQYVAALGANLVERGRYADADRVLQPLTTNTVPAVRAAAHRQLALACYRQDRFKDALKHFDTALADDVGLLTNGSAIEFRARVCEKLGDVDGAIAAYRLGAEINGKASALLYPLVKLEWAAGQKRDALDHLRRYTVAVGKDEDGLLKAAELHLLLGRLDDALELADRVAPDRVPTALARQLRELERKRRK